MPDHLFCCCISLEIPRLSDVRGCDHPANDAKLRGRYTIWGFQFQFLSSTFFLTLFIFCCVLLESSGRQVYLQAAAGSLLLCSLCGMNGSVASSCATVAMMGSLLLCRASEVPVRQTRAIYLLLALNLVVDIALWGSWKPSEVANVGHFNVYNFGRFIYCILPSCFVLYSFTDIWWKSDLVLLLLLGAVVIFCLSLRRWRLSGISCSLGIVCSIAVLASVAGDGPKSTNNGIRLWVCTTDTCRS